MNEATDDTARRHHPPALGWIGLGLALGWLAVAANIGGSARGQSLPPLDADGLRAACATDNPVLAVALSNNSVAPTTSDPPAIMALVDTPNDAATGRRPLAPHSEVGSIAGLAWEPDAGMLYAAAWLRRGTSFGPAGPGGIYRIDPATGAVDVLATISAGVDPHDMSDEADAPAAPLVGKLSLGDLDVSDDGSSLFVANLMDRRIVRISTADGSVTGAFRSPAVDLPWGPNARLGAVAWHDGWLYHGVVDSRERTGLPGDLGLHVYRSRGDGSEMEAVVETRLDYQRPVASWGPWQTQLAPWSIVPDGRVGPAQPWLTDIAFSEDGRMILGVRDRVTDMMPAWKGAAVGFGAGDVLVAEPTPDGWTVLTFPERIDDLLAVDEASWGWLAALPGLEVVVTGALGPSSRQDAGAAWFDIVQGTAFRTESLGALSPGARADGVNGIGDIEVLCDPPVPDSVPASATARAAGTATARSATQTAMPGPTDDDPAVLIPSSCSGENPFVATTCYPAAFLGTGLTTASVIGFRDTPSDDPPLTLGRADQVGSVWGLAWWAERRVLYASAYHKRLAFHGPAGTGGIYAIEVDSGAVRQFAQVADAGANRHGPPNQISDDSEATRWVGRTSLGDLEVVPWAGELLVVNLKDRHIHRFDLADGTFIGRFEHGAAGEPWSAEARPFALGVSADRVYHGVVRSAERSGRREDLVGVVYESAVDGSDMREVLRFPLTYARDRVEVPGVLNDPPRDVDVIWRPWVDDYQDVAGGGTRASVYPQPMLADITFDAADNMVIGLRDRQGDMTLAGQVQVGNRIMKPGLSVGDVLHATRDGDRWTWDPDAPEHYSDRSGSAGESLLGGLAWIPWLDQVVTGQMTASNLAILQQGFVAQGTWLDNPSGAVRRTERVCQIRLIPVRPTPLARAAHPEALEHSEWLPAISNGDMEMMCADEPTLPSPTPTASTTPSPVPSGRPSPTPTRTGRPSATPTPGPIFLPIALDDRCDPTVRRSDIALVLDASTSMDRLTEAGRPKWRAVNEAAGAFLSLLVLDPDAGTATDRVAVVGFNDRSWIAEPLSSDRSALQRGIDEVTDELAQGTRLDLALTTGGAALRTGAPRPDVARVVILLTDGLPNRVPTPVTGGGQEDAVTMAADALKDDGIRIFTIGVGRPDAPDLADRINVRLLRRVASRPTMAYITPDAESVTEIYRAIAVVIPCPPEAYWPYPQRSDTDLRGGLTR